MSFPKTVKTALVTQLRDEIVRGTYRPGERLRLEELAQRFDVSTMPIREALSALAAEGLVTIQPHRGALVTRFTPDEMRELYEMRAVLERLATEKAVPRRTLDAISQLEQLAGQMEALGDTFDMARFSQYNMQFHTTLYALSGMAHLEGLIRDLRFRVQHYLHTNFQATHSPRQGNEQHREVVELVRAGDAQGAGAVIYRHIFETGLAIAERMEQEDAAQSGR